MKQDMTSPSTLKLSGRALYATKGAAQEYGLVGCNFYTGCPHNCTYCYLKRGVAAKTLGGTTVRLKKQFRDEMDALEKLCHDVRRHLDTLRRTGVFFSFTTDPLLPETRDLTLSALNMLTSSRVPAIILTKRADWLDYERADVMLQAIADRRYDVRFGFTLTGRDDMEPGASTNLDRIHAMRTLHNMGIATWASIEPVIDWLSAHLYILLSLDCCSHYKIGLRSGVKQDYYGLASSGTALDYLTDDITAAGRTVYLKRSARELLRRCFKPEHYDKVMARTVEAWGQETTTTTND